MPSPIIPMCDWILKNDQIVTLGLFHFIAQDNGCTSTLHIHSAITRLHCLACFSRVSFVNHVNSRLKQWDHGGHYMEGMDLKFTPVIKICLLCHLSIKGVALQYILHSDLCPWSR